MRTRLWTPAAPPKRRIAREERSLSRRPSPFPKVTFQFAHITKKKNKAEVKLQENEK